MSPVKVLGSLKNFLLRRVHRVPVWVWIFGVCMVLTIPNALGFWFNLKTEPAWLVGISAIAAIAGTVMYVFGFGVDDGWLGIPKTKR